MKSFSLGKLKDKVGRRFSDPSAEFDRTLLMAPNRRNSHSNEVIVVSETDEGFGSLSGSSSLTHHGGGKHHSRSISVSRKQAKELIRQETSLVIQRKLFALLKDLGLQLPIPLKTTAGGLSSASSKSIKIYVANTHDCIYLASSVSTSFTYEDADNGGNQIPHLDSHADLQELSRESTPGLSVTLEPSQAAHDAHDVSSVMRTIAKKMRALKSANYLCTQIDSQTPIPHLFAVIVELKKDCCAKSVEVGFLSTTKTQWPTADSANRHQCEETFKIGNLEWEFSFQDADFFINLKNSNDTKLRDIAPEHLARRTRQLTLVDTRETSSEFFDGSSLFSGLRRYSLDSISLATTESTAELQKAGLYVFLLPILIPPNIPATVYTANGSLAHNLCVRVPGSHERLTKRLAASANYNLPMVRTPPSLANSIADKPIYVNRIWNDSLHYAITFPRKYVSLGSEHTINVKLVPLVKDVTVKRIKFNILEKVTYASKDLLREYDFDGDDPFMRSRSTKLKERVIPLCELRTKSKSNYSGTEPFKEEVLSCPDNNLLYSCYEERPSTSSRRRSNDHSVMVASPLDINIALPFLTSKADKEILTSSISEDDDRRKISSAAKKDLIASLDLPSLPIIGSLESHISHLHGSQLYDDGMEEDVLKLDSSFLLHKKQNGRNDTISQGYTVTAKALSPDSNYRHIQISHRLQVSFRISKPDASDNNKMHHYEVVVDTPIILLSAKCNDASIQLPEYEDVSLGCDALPERPRGINFRTPSYVGNGISIKPFNPSESEQPPSFEEATSAPGSPILRSASISSLDPSTPSHPPAYENVPLNTAATFPDEIATIDDVLIDPDLSLSQRKPSTIRASLQSSFAPSISASSGHTGNSDAGALENSVSSNSDTTSNSTTTSDDSSSRTRQSAVDSSSSDDIDFVELVSESLVADSNASAIHLGSTGLAATEIHNVVVDEAQFDQRLPLLRNASTTGIEAHVSRMSIRNKGLVLDDWKKILTETLSEEAQPQSLFHAY